MLGVPVFKYIIPTPLVPFFAPSPPPSHTSALPSPLALLLPPTLTVPRCVFLPDNGAFFVNYVITSSLFGTGMDMLRPGSLVMYSTRLFFSQSEPARVHIRKVRAGSPLSTALLVALGRASGRGPPGSPVGVRGKGCFFGLEGRLLTSSQTDTEPQEQPGPLR